MTVTAVTHSAEDTRALAAAVAGLAEPGDIVVLAGDLGSGKTVWVQGFARGLGIDHPVTSPTFALVHPYGGGRLNLLHADVYRLDRLSEVVDLGLVEQLDEGGVACIEWGDMAEAALPADFLEVTLRGSGDVRTVVLRPVGPGWTSRRDALARAVTGWTA